MQTWLYKLRYIYKNIRKDVFVDRHKQFDIIEDYIYFLKKIKELISYIVEFNKYDTTKPKVYSSNYTIKRKNQQLVIVITYDECFSSANNSAQKAGT